MRVTKTPWFREFKAEIERDARLLREQRDERAGKSPWSYEEASAKTKLFYVERITGYATCLSITIPERDELLRLIEGFWPG